MQRILSLAGISHLLSNCCLAQEGLAAPEADLSDFDRIRSLFNDHPTFNEELLIRAFREKPEEEFLLSETEDLVDELIQEFGDYLKKSSIGEATH